MQRNEMDIKRWSNDKGWRIPSWLIACLSKYICGKEQFEKRPGKKQMHGVLFSRYTTRFSSNVLVLETFR